MRYIIVFNQKDIDALLKAKISPICGIGRYGVWWDTKEVQAIIAHNIAQEAAKGF